MDAGVGFEAGAGEVLGRGGLYGGLGRWGRRERGLNEEEGRLWCWSEASRFSSLSGN